MAFFDDLPNKDLTPRSILETSQQDEANAKGLAAAVQRARKVMAPIRLDRWTQEFAKLAKHAEQPRVDRVATWYAAHIGEAYLPQAYSAATFRKRFIEIETAMQRAEQQPCDPKFITEEAHALQRTMGYAWPDHVGTLEDELVCIQTTLTNYAKWLAALQRARKAAVDPQRFNLLDGVYNYCHPDPREHCLEWLANVHRMAWEMEGYRGKLRKAGWRADHKRWIGQLREWAGQLTHNEDNWRLVEEAVSANS